MDSSCGASCSAKDSEDSADDSAPSTNGEGDDDVASVSEGCDSVDSVGQVETVRSEEITPRPKSIIEGVTVSSTKHSIDRVIVYSPAVVVGVVETTIEHVKRHSSPAF